MKVGIILPSRGLIFSETADEILQNVKTVRKEGWDVRFFFSHGQPIPQCFEKPTQRALLDQSITHLWFVEDDMKLPPDTLSKLLSANQAVVTIDYPVNKDGRGSIFKYDKQIVFCGTGCLLVKREVFAELRNPIWRTDMRWNIKNYGEYLKMRVNRDESEGYGLHDVNFCMNLYHLGIPIHAIKGKLGQRKLVSLGEAGTNEGAHNIEVWTKIVPGHLLKQVRKFPVEKPKGNMTTVMTPTGEITVSPSHAKTLISKGKATKMPKRRLVVDFGLDT